MAYFELWFRSPAQFQILEVPPIAEMFGVANCVDCRANLLFDRLLERKREIAIELRVDIPAAREQLPVWFALELCKPIEREARVLGIFEDRTVQRDAGVLVGVYRPERCGTRPDIQQERPPLVAVDPIDDILPVVSRIRMPGASCSESVIAPSKVPLV